MRRFLPPTVRSYMEILEDTLLGFYLRPWKGSKRKALQSAKFFIFDLGVRWFLAGVDTIPRQSDLFGKAFEHFIISEVYAANSYKRTREMLYFWRTTHQEEVDFIIGDRYAIEIKSKSKTTTKDARHLIKLREEGFAGKLIVLSQDPIDRIEGGVSYTFWRTFLSELWQS